MGLTVTQMSVVLTHMLNGSKKLQPYSSNWTTGSWGVASKPGPHQSCILLQHPRLECL